MPHAKLQWFARPMTIAGVLASLLFGGRLNPKGASAPDVLVFAPISAPTEHSLIPPPNRRSLALTPHHSGDPTLPERTLGARGVSSLSLCRTVSNFLRANYYELRPRGVVASTVTDVVTSQSKYHVKDPHRDAEID